MSGSNFTRKSQQKLEHLLEEETLNFFHFLLVVVFLTAKCGSKNYCLWPKNFLSFSNFIFPLWFFCLKIFMVYAQASLSRKSSLSSKVEFKKQLCVSALVKRTPFFLPGVLAKVKWETVHWFILLFFLCFVVMLAIEMSVFKNYKQYFIFLCGLLDSQFSANIFLLNL